MIRILLFFFTPLRLLHRVRFEGTENIPDCPCLMVANHSIGAVVEIFSILYAWEKRFGFRYDRPAYGLAHRVSSRVPIVSGILERVGSIPAEHGLAKKALQSGASVLVFHGGNWEVTRGFWRKNEVDFGNHRGWVRVAKESGVDVLPIGISGSYRVNPVLGRSRWLAHLSLFDLLFTIRWVPITLGQFVWTGLFVHFASPHFPIAVTVFGAIVTFLFTPLFTLFPAPITIRFGNTISTTLDESDLEEQGVLAVTQLAQS
jgi:1-acyl-sn-glycerol-3-phosphate acyltransferase